MTSVMSATLSYSTEVFSTQPFDAAIRWAQMLGLAAMEVGRRHAEQLHNSPQARERAMSLWAQCRVRPASLHAWTGIDGLDQVCPTAAGLGAGLVVVHCRHEELQADLAACVKTVARWVDWCNQHHVTLTVENSSRQPLRPFVDLFAAVPGLKLTLDVKHAYKPQLLGLTHADYLAPLGDRLANMHLVGIDPARDDLGDAIPAGNDPIDYSELAADLLRRNYRGLITVESCWPDLPEHMIESSYFDLLPQAGDEPTIAHRLSRHNVRFFAGKFARVIAPAS
jgi:sugar phosphate isomerase/epimerase